jgi:hypothetical protein
MNKKSLLVIVLCYIISPTYSQLEKEIKPLISVEFEAKGVVENFYTLSGTDSIVDGINGEAMYFSGSARKANHIMINNSETLSALWKDQDFTIEVWVQTKADNKEFQVIASNKDWNSGDIKDYTDNRYAGWSRVSGLNKGIWPSDHPALITTFSIKK